MKNIVSDLATFARNGDSLLWAQTVGGPRKRPSRPFFRAVLRTIMSIGFYQRFIDVSAGATYALIPLRCQLEAQKGLPGLVGSFGGLIIPASLIGVIVSVRFHKARSHGTSVDVSHWRIWS